MSQPRTAYHHGALRAALVDRALRLTETAGHEGLSLRELAGEVGVSRGAPYRHFRDRGELLVAVAAEGVRAMGDEFDRALAAGSGPADRLRAGARALIRFALERTHLFRLMSSAEVAAAGARDAGFLALQSALTEDIRRALAAVDPAADPETVRLRHIAMWATLSGYAAIRQNGLLAPHVVGDLPLERVEEAVIAAAIGQAGA